MIDRDTGPQLSSVILLALDSEHADGAFCNGMRMRQYAHLLEKRGHMAGVRWLAAGFRSLLGGGMRITAQPVCIFAIGISVHR